MPFGRPLSPVNRSRFVYDSQDSDSGLGEWTRLACTMHYLSSLFLAFLLDQRCRQHSSAISEIKKLQDKLLPLKCGLRCVRFMPGRCCLCLTTAVSAYWGGRACCHPQSAYTVVPTSVFDSRVVQVKPTSIGSTDDSN